MRERVRHARVKMPKPAQVLNAGKGNLLSKIPKPKLVVAQVEYIENYISKIGSSKLTPDQIKYLQTKLPQLDSSKTSVKLTAQCIKSLVEISERGWKEREQPTQNHNFDNPQGEQN